MLRITVVLVPHGNESQRETISEITIWNTGIKNEHEEYKYKFQGWWKDTNDEIRKIYQSSVLFDRRHMVWLLIYRVANKIIKPFFYVKE